MLRNRLLNLHIYFSLIWFSFVCEYLQMTYQIYFLIFLGVGFILAIFLQRWYWPDLKKFPEMTFLIFIFAIFVSMRYACNRKITYPYFYIPLISFFTFYSIQSLKIKELRYKITYLLSISAFLVFVFGLQEFIFKRNFLYEQFISNPFYRFIGKRMMSFHYHPSVLATYFLCVIPFSVFLIKSKRNQRDLIIGFLGLGASLSGILLTFTRTAFLILFICFFFYFLLTKKKYLIYIFLFFLILTSVATLLINKNSSFSRFSPFNPYHVGSIKYRLERVPIAFKIWMIQPFTGVGFGNFRHLFNVFGQKVTPYEFKIPDNMYLSLLSETGLLGLCSFILFLFSLFHYALKKIKLLSGRSREFLKISIFGFCMLLLNMLSYDMFYWHMPLFFFWFYAGLIASFCVKNEPDI